MSLAISDDEVIGRVKNGDLTSYAILAARYDLRLRRLARKLLRSEADAEDAVQGAHLLALRHFDQFAGRSSYLSWISAITANEALTQMRRRKGLVEAGEDEIAALRSRSRDPERQAIDSQYEAILTVAVQSLPSAYSSVFRLREIDCLSTTETGKRLGLTNACVKTRLLRARSLLRRRLEGVVNRAGTRPVGTGFRPAVGGAEAAN